MQAQKSNKQQLSCRARFFLFIAFFSLITLAGAIFVLGSSGVFPLGDTWSRALGTLFAVLGVIFGLGQWLMPLNPLQLTKNISTNTSTTSNNVSINMFPSHNLMKLPKDHAILQKLENNSDIQYGRNGAVIIYTHEDVFRAPITLRAINHEGGWDFRPEIATAYVEREIVRIHAIYFAVFPCLPEGNYRIDHVPLYFPLLGQNITIYKHQVIEVDARTGN